MAEQKVLFCPFCRESFEGERVCPEHELPLVPFQRLPRDASAGPHIPAPEAALAAWDLRFGRGAVLAAAVLNALALALPLVASPRAQRSAPAVAVLAVAFPSLWTLGLVSFTLVFVMMRRRTRAALAGVRLLVPLLALVSPATLLVAFARLGVFERGGPAPASALYLVLLASALMVAGGVRLGVTRDEP